MDEKFKTSTDQIVSNLKNFVEAEESEARPDVSKYMRRAKKGHTKNGATLNGPCQLRAHAPTKTGKIIRSEAAVDLIYNFKGTTHSTNHLKK